MAVMKKFLVLSIFSLFFACQVKAQIDPLLPAQVLVWTKKAQNQYESQLATMLIMSEGHIWYKKEVEETMNYQKQFNAYLDTMRCMIAYAAQTYGFYVEISRLIENMGKLSRQIGDAPSNVLAVAIHNHRNDIYFQLLNQGLGIIKTVRNVCVDKKMTEKQRIELVFSIRPQLQAMNKTLVMLTKLVKCTNLAQVWYGIEHNPISHEDGRSVILRESLDEWVQAGKVVKVNH